MQSATSVEAARSLVSSTPFLKLLAAPSISRVPVASTGLPESTVRQPPMGS